MDAWRSVQVPSESTRQRRVGKKHCCDRTGEGYVYTEYTLPRHSPRRSRASYYSYTDVAQWGNNTLLSGINDPCGHVWRR